MIVLGLSGWQRMSVGLVRDRPAGQTRERAVSDTEVSDTNGHVLGIAVDCAGGRVCQTRS